MKTEETLYKTYTEAQKDNLGKIALFTREGKKLTHGELLAETDRAAAGLLTYRSSDDFKVGVISSSSYEEAVFLLAASKIGAVSKFIDFTKNITEIAESIAESSINVLVIGAEFMLMEPFINPTAMPVIVLGDMPQCRANCLAYGDLLEKGIGRSCPAAEYRENACAVIINSSGTTGTAKPIELSDRAINTAVVKFINSDLPLNSSNIMLKIIPSFLGMGLITTLYTSLITGTPIVYFVAIGPQEAIGVVINTILSFPSFIQKNDLMPSTKLLLFASPMFYRSLYSMLNTVDDLSFLGCMLAGGSAMTKDELEIMDAAFAAKGCKVPVLNGYGQNEMAGGVTINQNGANKRGSAGRALFGTEIRIVDIESGKPIPKNTVGKILERSESLFTCYENMPERTAASFIEDEDGKLWFDTNDVGFMDDDGFLFISGRVSRIIIRFDIKVSLDKMENKIRKSKYIEDVGVIPLKGGVYDSAAALVVLKEAYRADDITPEMIIDGIQNSLDPLNELEKVDRLIIVDEIKYLSSGKIDYRELEKLATETLMND